jgi:hypothetical protein
MDMISQASMMKNMMDNMCLEYAKNNITSETKKRIEFPDGFSIEIDSIPDEDSIITLQIKFYGYIDKLQFEILKEIQVIYLSYYYFGFIKYDYPVLDKSQEYEKLAESLRTTLSDNHFNKKSKKLLFKIVNEYLRDFLKISGSRLDIDFPDIAGILSDIESISKHESPMVESTGETSTQEPLKNALIPTFCGLFHKGKKILFYGDNLTGKTVMAVDVAARNYLKNPLLFFIDGKKDSQKYLKILGNKGSIIDSQQVESKRQEIEEHFRNDAYNEIMMEKTKIPGFKAVSDIQKMYREVNARINRNDLNIKSADTLLAIENILEEKNKKSNIDLVVIDCLLALKEDEGRSVSGPFAKHILDWINQYERITFILIHHEDNAGDVTGHTITTHRRLLNMSENTLKKYDIVIIDEDIILSSIASNQCEIPISILRKIRRYASKDDTYNMLSRKISKALKAVETETLFKLPGFEWDDGEYKSGEKSKSESVDGISALTDIPSFCLAEHFVYRKISKERNLSEDSIVFLKPYKFKNIKYIMVSATVDKDICEYCFGKQNIKFYECKNASYKGILNQYYDKSMSRVCIDENPGILEKIRGWSGAPNMITFKKYAVGEFHFGNALGCDQLKGLDLDVVGTPYQVDFLYRLLPFTLGLRVNEDAEMKSCLVRHNGYKFHFTTFGDEHDVLRKFHFWMIESELEQAVGRARLLRCDCTVNLFSNFHLRQAIMKETEYEGKVA